MAQTDSIALRTDHHCDLRLHIELRLRSNTDQVILSVLGESLTSVTMWCCKRDCGKLLTRFCKVYKTVATPAVDGQRTESSGEL